MKRIEIIFQVVDDNEQILQLRTAYALEKMDALINSEPLISYAAGRDAKKFWESLILMGYLEEN